MFIAVSITKIKPDAVGGPYSHKYKKISLTVSTFHGVNSWMKLGHLF